MTRSRPRRPVSGRGKPQKPRPAPRPRRRRRPWNHRQLIAGQLGIAVLLTVFISFVLYLFVLLDIPDYRSVESYRPPQATLIRDRHGRVVDRVFSENRRVVALDKLPDLLPLAFVAAEDARFFQHPGVDFWSILRALIHNLRAGDRLQGGSTITQQVTRALLLSRRKLYSRKLKEAILAYRIDSRLSKEEILYIYLNEIYLGEGAYGIAAAADTYFGKEAAELELSEIALLAGLPQAPSRYSPLKDPGLARKRQAYVLNRMAEEGYITPTMARRAYKKELSLAPKRRAETENGYFLQQVHNQLFRRYGREAVRNSGLEVNTTLDPGIQQAAAEAVEQGVSALAAGLPAGSGAPQAGLIAMEAAGGRVRAVTGGTNFRQSQFNRAIQAHRQPGSAIKPLIYAAALENGFEPDSLLEDAPLTLPGRGGGRVWRPQNFDHRYLGPVTLRQGLILSRNTVAVRLLREVGVDTVRRLARNMGIESPLPADLSLALGAGEVSLLELTAAYTAFANTGRYAKPVFVESVRAPDGRLLEEAEFRPRPVLTRLTARRMDRLLTAVVEEGTGKLARGLAIPAAGKTGTTDRNRDAWFVGYTPQLVAGVWVGYDRPAGLGAGGTGGRIAAPLWRDFMERVIAAGSAGMVAGKHPRF